LAVKIFINYRRGDASAQAARLRDRLAARDVFGDANVVMDVNYLLPGQRFEDEIKRALSDTNVFLTVIGPRWTELLAERTASGERDYVREEIADALARGIIVIPVLMDRALLPRATELPEDIRGLLSYQKHEIAYETFGRDAAALAEAIKLVLKKVAKPDPRAATLWKATLWKALAASVFLASMLAAYVAWTHINAPGLPLPGPAEVATSTPKATPTTLLTRPFPCSERPDPPNELQTAFAIVGGSDSVEAKDAPGSSQRAFILELLAPYAVVCEDEQFYRITDLPSAAAKAGKVGYVLKDQVYHWPTREALQFTAAAFIGPRPEIAAWDDRPALQRFLQLGGSKFGPAFKEELADTMQRGRATRPYPVLNSETILLRNLAERRVFNILLPVALPPEAQDGDGKRALSEYPAVPFPVRDSEKLIRLRYEAARFNVDRVKGGILVRESYLFENDLLKANVLIDKKTLERLISLFSALSVTGVEFNAMKAGIESALSAIADGNYDPKENIAATIRKRFGIRFRTMLYEFNLEFLAGMNRDERLALTRRLGQANKLLIQFYDDNLEALDRGPPVWMPVSNLP
jgi:hypothetical protein